YAYLIDSTISMSSSTATTEKARGGGIFARGAVGLLGSSILDNKVVSVDGTAYGGGIASQEGVSAFARSTISWNTAHSDTRWSYGGGVIAGDNYGDQAGQAVFMNAVISGNVATSSCTHCFIQGGGVHAFGPIIAYYSAITNNHVISASGGAGTAQGGGLSTLSGDSDGDRVDGVQVFVNSTISGNSAMGGQSGAGYGGGLNAMSGSPIGLVMSTLAFNQASTEGGGAVFGDGGGTYNPQLYSSIVSNNAAPNAADIASTFGYALTIDGSHNVVISAASDVVLPAGTISFDPKLMPLAKNGGFTPNHELAPCSPAVDAGVNQFGSSPLDWDQRGDPYAREAGTATDIGAFELQANAAADVIFRHSFETPLCP
ncbi:MAG: choice-of-anchor Q domain-containing protein, partial [Dokdonella sp.]